MTLNLGATAITALRLGEVAVDKLMLGDVQVWPAAVAGPELWTPAHDAGVSEWFDPQDASTFTVTPEGLVTEWRSKIGGRVYAQSDAANAPRVTGKWLDVTGAKEILLTPDLVPTEYTYVIFVWPSVQLGHNENVDASIVSVITSSDQVRLYGNAIGGVNSWVKNWRENGADTRETPPTEKGEYLNIERPKEDALTPRIIGWELVNNPGGADSPHRMGRTMYAPSQMWIGESILLHPNPSLDLQQKIEGYLAHRHGIADRLPAGHPYLRNPPRQ